MAGIDFDVIRREVSMQEVLDLLGFLCVSRTGNQLHGPCPVHNSSDARSRSFSVNVDQGRYYCHKCGSNGNLLELWAAVKHLKIYAAALDLCHALGRDVPRLDSP